MKLSEKAQKFSKKILKHYPIPEKSTHPHSEDCSHGSENAASQHAPYLHMHDHRKVLIVLVTGKINL